MKVIKVSVHWAGLVPHSQIPSIDRFAHALFCRFECRLSNSVIEALACGTPVLGYDTGALPEMVPPKAGRIAPYGGNSWDLDPPDLEALLRAGMEVLQEREALRRGAREQAVGHFDVDHMVMNYQRVLLGD
jgi:glycosyltransferase involved in cell wall biosynthesis